MTNQTIDITKVYFYGQTIDAPHVGPDPARRYHFVANMEPATILGFSNHHAATRGWGWRGDALVQFADGSKQWVGLS